MSDHTERSELIERYLDGSLSVEEATAFERALAGDAAMRDELRCAREVEASLRRTFTPPKQGLTPYLVEQRPIVGWFTRHGQWLGVAALIVLTLTLALYFSPMFRSAAPPPFPQPGPSTATESLYRSLSRGGWNPSWTCGNDNEFAQSVVDQLGAPLLVRDDDAPDMVLVGWLYLPYGMDPIITDKTMTLMVTHDEAHIMVMIDRAENTENRPTVMPDSDLRIFEQRVGDLIAYEITPLEEPVVLPRMFIPESW